jgi:hypothetical protein
MWNELESIIGRMNDDFDSAIGFFARVNSIMQLNLDGPDKPASIFPEKHASMVRIVRGAVFSTKFDQDKDGRFDSNDVSLIDQGIVPIKYLGSSKYFPDSREMSELERESICKRVVNLLEHLRVCSSISRDRIYVPAIITERGQSIALIDGNHSAQVRIKLPQLAGFRSRSLVEMFTAIKRCYGDRIEPFDFESSVDRFSIQSEIMSCCVKFGIDCTATLCIDARCDREIFRKLIDAIRNSMDRVEMIASSSSALLQREVESIRVWQELAKQDLKLKSVITSDEFQGNRSLALVL